MCAGSRLASGDNQPDFVFGDSPDRTASGQHFAGVNRKESFHWFSGLDSREPIWTGRGPRPIGQVAVGDSVLDRYGKLDEVLYKCVQRKPTLEMSTGSFRYATGHSRAYLAFMKSEAHNVHKSEYVPCSAKYT